MNGERSPRRNGPDKPPKREVSSPSSSRHEMSSRGSNVSLGRQKDVRKKKVKCSVSFIFINWI